MTNNQGAAGRHPVARLSETFGRLPRYLILGRALLRDPSIRRWRKLALGASIAYLVSPIDLIPGIIPVAGQLDDLAAVLFALRLALRGSSSVSAAAHLRAAQLEPDDIARDLEIVRGAAAWLAEQVGRTAARIAVASAKALDQLVRFGAAGGRRIRQRRDRATP